MPEKGSKTIRRHRLHFSSIPSCRSFAINCPHSHRASALPEGRFALALTAWSIPEIGCCIEKSNWNWERLL